MAAKKFVHVVNFWLKKGLSAAEIKQFETGLQSLVAVESLIYFNVGVPAETQRNTIDRSYSYCLLTVFKDQAGHDAYQVHPIHLKFVEGNKPLWEKVLIYDSTTL